MFINKDSSSSSHFVIISEHLVFCCFITTINYLLSPSPPIHKMLLLISSPTQQISSPLNIKNFYLNHCLSYKVHPFFFRSLFFVIILSKNYVGIVDCWYLELFFLLKIVASWASLVRSIAMEVHCHLDLCNFNISTY